MPLNYEQLLEVATILSREEGLRVAVQESVKGGLLAGAGAFAGGLLAGPVGIAIGATVGGVAGAFLSSGKFRPVPEVLLEMQPRQKNELAQRLQEALRDVDIYDATTLVTFLMGNTPIKMQILRVIINYVKNELRMTIVD